MRFAAPLNPLTVPACSYFGAGGDSVSSKKIKIVEVARRLYPGPFFTVQWRCGGVVAIGRYRSVVQRSASASASSFPLKCDDCDPAAVYRLLGLGVGEQQPICETPVRLPGA